jgi:hypothetical protein
MHISDESGGGTAFVIACLHPPGRPVEKFVNTPTRRFRMKRALSLALAAVFTLTILGCHASVEPNDSGDTHYKKQTTYNRDGTVTTETKTETTRNP